MNSNKIKGALYGCALGDARGALTEFSTYQQIKEKYNNELEDFQPMERFVRLGGILGTVTDDFGSSYYVMKKLIETNGRLDKKTAEEIIIECRSMIEGFGK